MKDINYRSDFDFLLRLEGPGGEAQGFPTFDFRGEIWPERALEYGEMDCIAGPWEETARAVGLKPYVFYRRGEEMEGCRRHAEGIHVIADNHGLPPGGLILILRSHIPNPIYPDRTRTIEDRYRLDIRLTEGCGNEPEKQTPPEIQIPHARVTAYLEARQAGYEGTEEEYRRLTETPEAMHAATMGTLESFRRMEASFKEFEAIFNPFKGKLDGYPPMPPADDCIYSLLNGRWAPIAAPGELIIVTGGRESKN